MTRAVITRSSPSDRLDLSLAAAGLGWDLLLDLILSGDLPVEEHGGRRWVRRGDVEHVAPSDALAAIAKAERQRIRVS
jgi:hypothetical protein